MDHRSFVSCKVNRKSRNALINGIDRSRRIFDELIVAFRGIFQNDRDRISSVDAADFDRKPLVGRRILVFSERPFADRKRDHVHHVLDESAVQYNLFHGTDGIIAPNEVDVQFRNAVIKFYALNFIVRLAERIVVIGLAVPDLIRFERYRDFVIADFDGCGGCRLSEAVRLGIVGECISVFQSRLRVYARKRDLRFERQAPRAAVIIICIGRERSGFRLRGNRAGRDCKRRVLDLHEIVGKFARSVSCIDPRNRYVIGLTDLTCICPVTVAVFSDHEHQVPIACKIFLTRHPAVKTYGKERLHRVVSIDDVHRRRRRFKRSSRALHFGGQRFAIDPIERTIFSGDRITVIAESDLKVRIVVRRRDFVFAGIHRTLRDRKRNIQIGHCFARYAERIRAERFKIPTLVRLIVLCKRTASKRAVVVCVIYVMREIFCGSFRHDAVNVHFDHTRNNRQFRRNHLHVIVIRLKICDINAVFRSCVDRGIVSCRSVRSVFHFVNKRIGIRKLARIHVAFYNIPQRFFRLGRLVVRQAIRHGKLRIRCQGRTVFDRGILNDRIQFLRLDCQLKCVRTAAQAVIVTSLTVKRD